MDYAAKQLGFQLFPKSVIHDSNQNLINIEDLPYINKIYYRFFRMYEREVIGVDFKYDLELLKNYRDHTVFEFDYDTGIMSLDGPEDDINYYVKYLSKKWDIEKVENENEVVTPASEDLFLDFSNDYNARGHQYCMHPLIRRSCPMVEGRKYKINHDWANDPIMKKIESLPLDSTTW